jgi:hypothetical protein
MTDVSDTQALVPATSVPTKGELAAIKEQVRLIANTEFVPKGLRGNPHATLACILYGREIGLGPMESLSEVHMIDGSPALSAKAKVKRARQAGHSIQLVEETPTSCTVRGKRGDNGDEMTTTYTVEMAKRAGLLGKQNWQRHPEDMLWARAVSRLCRRLFDDVPGLGMLDPDEAELTQDDRDAQQVEDVLAVNHADAVGAGPVDGPIEDAEFDDAPSGGEEGAAQSATDTGAVAAVATPAAAPSSASVQEAFPIPEAARRRRNLETGED